MADPQARYSVTHTGSRARIAWSTSDWDPRTPAWTSRAYREAKAAGKAGVVVCKSKDWQREFFAIVDRVVDYDPREPVGQGEEF